LAAHVSLPSVPWLSHSWASGLDRLGGRPASVVGAATASARRRRVLGRRVLGRRARRGEGEERALEGEHRLAPVEAAHAHARRRRRQRVLGGEDLARVRARVRVTVRARVRVRVWRSACWAART
jgi:hypothetical protein